MHTFINSPLQIGSLTIPHRLIQGPLAGYSCAPFRTLFNHYTPPAYCVSEMSSAVDLLYKHGASSRYLYRDPEERLLAYQISGTEPSIMAEAARSIEKQGANLIDINCGCPKTKIRKKGAGSALLDTPQQLIDIIKTVRSAIKIPLTIKIRIQGSPEDLILAQHIQDAGADALIVHGRRWMDDYDVASDVQRIAQIKKVVSIPVIANGDIANCSSLQRIVDLSGCDAYMIGRAGTGKPWLYQELLGGVDIAVGLLEHIRLFMRHLEGLAVLENEYKAILQSKSLVRYYFNKLLDPCALTHFYQLKTLVDLERFMLRLTIPIQSR